MSAVLELTLCRGATTDQGTVGWLMMNYVPVCFVMELPWRDNQANVSCIPAGRYQVSYLPRSASGKYRDVYHVQDVPDRSGILIHPGNFAGDKQMGYQTDSWGCLLPATRLGVLGGQKAGLASRAALRKLHGLTHRKDFNLTIVEV